MDMANLFTFSQLTTCYEKTREKNICVIRPKKITERAMLHL